MPDTALVSEEIEVKEKDKVPALLGGSVLVCETETKQTTYQIVHYKI